MTDQVNDKQQQIDESFIPTDVQTAVRSIYQLGKINLDAGAGSELNQDEMYAHILTIKNCS